VHAEVAQPLAEGLVNRVVCRDRRIRDLIPVELDGYREAIRTALGPRNFRFLEPDLPAGWVGWETYRYPGDPEWAGGAIYREHWRVLVRATPEVVWDQIEGLGGENGWYFHNWLWTFRGALDRLAGGIGMRKSARGSRLTVGGALDFWRIVAMTPCRELRLVAESKIPGEGVLSFRLRDRGDGTTELFQVAQFMPRGLGGLAYWAVAAPFHKFIFPGLIREIARRTGKPLVAGPERLTLSSA
jgi:hypothetical protein